MSVLNYVSKRVTMNYLIVMFISTMSGTYVMINIERYQGALPYMRIFYMALCTLVTLSSIFCLSTTVHLRETSIHRHANVFLFVALMFLCCFQIYGLNTIPPNYPPTLWVMTSILAFLTFLSSAMRVLDYAQLLFWQTGVGAIDNVQ